MLFQLTTETECELTTFVGRTQKSGPDDVPAVSFRLLLTSMQNTMLDMFSPTIRATAYAPVEGQEQLPGVEPSTPILRSKDLKHWAPETRLEGWTVTLARGRTEATALTMGSCKVDDFKLDFHDGGHIDIDMRISTADVDEAGAGMLWGRQKRKVFVTIKAPEMPAKGGTEATGAEIDGTKGHPGLAAAEAAAAAGQGDLLAGTPEEALAASVGGDASTTEGGGPGAGPDDEQRDDDEGGSPDADAAKPARRGRKTAAVA